MKRVPSRRGIKRSLAAVIIGMVLSLSGSAAQIRIATWNARELFTVQEVRNRGSDLRDMYAAVRPNILCVQEVCSRRIVDEIRKEIGWQNCHIAWSDFEQKERADHSDFEVGILSDYPFEQVIEYDPSPDNSAVDPDELPLLPLIKLGLPESRMNRGFLWARIDNPNLTLIVLHLKSSRRAAGTGDRGNAQKREFIAAAAALSVLEDKVLYPQHSYVVLGDFNVGHSDVRKNGTDLLDDCYAVNCPPGRDPYDDTHAIFRAGIVGGLRMKNLTLSIPDTTYPTSPGSPIDNIYVDGAAKNSFASARKSTNTFGSDHFPVWTTLTTP